MTRGTAIVAIIALIVVILLITVNVTKCETNTGPFGFLRFTACTQEPVIDTTP